MAFCMHGMHTRGKRIFIGNPRELVRFFCIEPPMPDPLDAIVNASACPRLFIDGGSNTGEHVAAFYKGAFYRCAVASPNRLYGSAWKNASAAVRRAWMQPLRDADAWCVRSFDSAPGAADRLNARDRHLPNVQYIDAALSTSTTANAKRHIVRFSNHSFGTTAHYFSHEDIHARTVPILHSWVTRGQSLDVRAIIRRYMGTASHIALKLDVEGEEFAILGALAEEPHLLCSLSFLFVEYHNLKFNLTKYPGFREDEYFRIGGRIHNAMDSVPGCKLRIDWRSFWSACGEPMRMNWMRSYQATGRNASTTVQHKKQRRKGRRLRLGGT